MISSPSHPTTMRKSRRARLPIASTNSELKFEPTEAHWVGMESAYGFKFAADDREEIVRLVASYFLFQPFERGAPFVDDAKKWLTTVQSAAEEFYQSLFPDEPITEEEREASSYPRIRIEQCLEKYPLPYLRSMQDVHTIMSVFLRAAELVAKDLKDGRGNGFVEGTQWGRLVNGLTKWFKSKSLPTGASKGANKSKSDKPSAFVAFIHAMQLSFPKECQRHMPGPLVPLTATNLGALAAAICEARKRDEARGFKSENARSEFPA